jgi:hypothetical protein
MALDGVAGIRLLLTGKAKETGTIVKAHFHFYRSLGKWLKRRRENKKLIHQRNMAGYYPHSIVWNYFIRRKRKFPELGWEPTKLK